MHRAERLRHEMKMIELRVEQIHADLMEALVRQYAKDKAFLRAIDRFTGHTQYGWETALGSDGRLIKATRRMGWNVMRQIILRVRARRW